MRARRPAPHIADAQTRPCRLRGSRGRAVRERAPGDPETRCSAALQTPCKTKGGLKKGEAGRLCSCRRRPFSGRSCLSAAVSGTSLMHKHGHLCV